MKRLLQTLFCTFLAFVFQAEGGFATVLMEAETENSQNLPEVTKFTIINADNDQEYYQIGNGAEYTLYSIGDASEINIRAYTDPEPTGSVRFELKGPENRSHVENNSYYALFGNRGSDFFGWKPKAGTYTLTATPYTGQNGRGKVGRPLQVTFRIIDPALPFIGSVVLIDAETNSEFLEPNLPEPTFIYNGAEIHLLGHRELNIRAYTEPEQVGSVKFEIKNLSAGNETNTHIENVAPYALGGNKGYDFFTVPYLIDGSYQLKITPYTGPNGRGQAGIPFFATFSLAHHSLPEVTRFELIDAETQESIIFDIQDGQEINLSELNVSSINIEPQFWSEYWPIKSAVISLSGPDGYFKLNMSNEFPFRLFSGLDGFSPAPGIYTVRADPYTEEYQLGHEGIGKSVTFTIINSSDNTAQRKINVFPNPGEGEVHLSIANANQELLQVKMFDLTGREVMNRVSLNYDKPGELTIDAANLENKPYIIQVYSKEGTQRIKWVKK